MLLEVKLTTPEFANSDLQPEECKLESLSDFQ